MYMNNVEEVIDYFYKRLETTEECNILETPLYCDTCPRKNDEYPCLYYEAGIRKFIHD